MDSSLRLVSERFDHVRGRAAHLFESDENFHELCGEYEACVGSLARLESSGPAAGGIRNEYAALLLCLERELLRYLEEHPAGDAS